MSGPDVQVFLHPFYTLPAELVLDIVDMLPPDAFINFVFANYPLLRAYGLAPTLSSARISYLVRQTRIPTHFQLLPFPPEINLQILRCFQPIDLMNFVMANYQHMTRQGIAPPLTPETVYQLRRSIDTGAS
ncbi:hypothetical protein AAFC00_001304 [Neodothiora populina]|uniref:F-box domain-containing protein n=1 Tax=Neodothiora populina TaxID=2781224 RepID=A0ABR3PNI1_9PEZI